MRDDFSAKAIRLLAARVGHHCSNPNCVRSTSGPAANEKHAVSIGVAAHITAAAPGGKRYDANMKPEERGNGTNGIWLCQSCAKLIDSDENRYTVALLHQWKEDAVQRALDAIACGGPLGPVKPPTELDAADEKFLSGLDLPSTDAVSAVSSRLRAASLIDIEAFRAQRGRPARIIALPLRFEKNASLSPTLESLAQVTELGEPILLVAPGGTGKSITVLQIAERMLARDGSVPLLVPLGEWSDREDDFFDFLLRRNAFGSFRRQHLMQMAYHGRLVLVLDGWNELTPEARLRATNDVTALQRDYPQLGLIISTRRQALPMTGLVVEIDTLSQDQQMELARAARGQEGVDLVDRAWRTTGVRELVGIPLYLNALLTLPKGESFPETKEAVLRMFVQQNETTPDRVERLQRDTLHQHRALLVGLAAEANRTANTVISEKIANRSVSKILQQLSEDGQIGPVPHPRVVVDGLVGAHLLVRLSGAEGGVSFQHQLFQEWYAAEEVEKLMFQAGAGDAGARKLLREEVINWPSWEESILFSCDRLSRSNDAGIRAVAAAINDTLSIDPVLAAAMIDRAADAVWLRTRERVLWFVARWHAPGTFDRAVRFMVASGKAEFADLIWPLASNADDRIQIDTFRAADRFRTSVLGPDAKTRLRTLPAPQRKIALSEIASNSGLDGMELAARLAADDPDSEVTLAVVESLTFRRGDQQVKRIMQSASDSVWKALAKVGYPDHLGDALLNERLKRERTEARAHETDPVRLLRRIVEQKPDNAEARITELVGTPGLALRDSNVEHLVAYAHSKFPGAVAAGITARLLNDLPLPYRAGEYLREMQLVDSGPLSDIVLDTSTSERRLNAVAAIIGPVTVTALFDRLFTIDDQVSARGHYDEGLADSHARFVGAITSTRQNIFMEVLATRAQNDNPRHIGLMADLIARHGHSSENPAPPIGLAHRSPLRTIIERWITTLQQSANPVRHVSSQVARAAARLADSSLAEPLRLLLERDLADQAAARAAHLAARGTMRTLDVTGYTAIYARAFAAMHDEAAIAVLTRDLADLRWGIDAAGALYEIWSMDHPPKEKSLFSWDDFSQHLSRRAKRDVDTPSTSAFAEAIFAVVRTLGDPARSDQEQQHAIELAGVGLALPHGTKRREIDALLALPQTPSLKNHLLVAAARAGEVVPATQLIEGLRNLLDAAETQTWRLDENRGELMGWIRLFPFSDDPTRVHEALALLPEQRRRPYAVRRLLQTLPQSPAAPALATLEQLAADNPAFLQEFEWINAVIKLDTEAAALVILDQLCGGQLKIRDGFRLSNALAGWASRYPAVLSTMIARYPTLTTGKIPAVLEMAFHDLTDEQVFMTLFDGHVDGPHPFRGVANALRNLAIGRRPSKEWTGAFEEIGLPLTTLRARLFAMLPANDSRARLAKKCLIAIEEYRDDRGRVSNEPRHPDIETDRAWPPEADEVA